MRAVFVDAGTFGTDASFDLLKSLPMEWEFADKSTPAQIVERLKNAAIAVTNKAVFNQEILQSLPSLKLLCVSATGVNCVDLAAAKSMGITVCNVPSYSKGTVPQLTILLMLSLANSFIPYIEDVRKGRWQHSPHFCFLDYPIFEVMGKTLGIVGYGNLGRQVAKIATSMGMQILVAEHSEGRHPTPDALPLSEVLKQCDFLTIHAPLTAATKNLLGKKELMLMKKSAFVLNVSRGGIINEEALAAALKERMIAGAALDVLSEEPPSPSHPLLDPSIPNLILTPHIGWASAEARQTILQVTRDNIEAFLKGSPQNQV